MNLDGQLEKFLKGAVMRKQSTEELLNELFAENEIPMSDRNEVLYDAILDSQKKKSRNGWLFF